ncbi:MAG: DUF2027 domain-containing protein [Prevotellaceae bacterium]|jgi:hypothetical protein|nr:DUF2027 domain-containing protein [Prevotellaceae bacterium]
MKYKIGDKVRFLNDVGGGKISRILNTGMVNVMDEDGFEIPAAVSEIVVVEYAENSYKEFAKTVRPENSCVKAEKPVKKIVTANEKKDTATVNSDSYGLLLAFLPAKSSYTDDSGYDMYFINDSSFYCMYTIARRKKNGVALLMDSCDIEPETKKYATHLSEHEINAGILLTVTFFLYKHTDYKLYQPEQVNISPNPVKFVRNSFCENDFFEDNAYLIKIASDEIPDMKIEINPKELEKAIKQKKNTAPVIPAPAKKIETEEIDLHIEELIENTKLLSNGEMLEIQIDHFCKSLERGLCSKIKQMIFIHGVGNGKLKHEIRRLLDTRYAGKVRYQDASFKEYGYGATLVIIS